MTNYLFIYLFPSTSQIFSQAENIFKAYWMFDRKSNIKFMHEFYIKVIVYIDIWSIYSWTTR